MCKGKIKSGIKGGNKNFLEGRERSGKKLYFCRGELAEWSIAAVLKTVDLHGSGGSNPSLSASQPSKE